MKRVMAVGLVLGAASGACVAGPLVSTAVAAVRQASAGRSAPDATVADGPAASLSAFADPFAPVFRLPVADDETPEAVAASLGAPELSGQGVTQSEFLLAQRQADAVPTGGNSSWQFVGPTNIGGRIVDMALDPTTKPSTVYAAVSSGGVMKSTDSGVTWSPAYPDSLPQAMGAIARGSDGTLYAGTGEANPSGGGTTFMGEGIYRSTDGAKTWQFSGLEDSGAFGRLAVNPQNPKEVWAAATGALSWVSSQRGLYHSTDGGQTWQLSLAPVNDTTGAIDVAIDPANPNIILASLWDRYRNNGAFYYGGVGSGLYRSTDDGKTWTRLDNSNILGPACNWDSTASGLNTSPDLGRIGIAFSSDGNLTYIQSSGANGPDKGFYVSRDQGATWICGAGEPGSKTAGYEWVFGRLWVDPNDPLHIYAADVSLEESLNGGATWVPVVGPHSDQHAMVWDPNALGTVYLGGDGGAYHSTADGANGTWTHATVEPWVQPYQLAISQQDPQRMAAALQDNGSLRTWSPGVEPANPPLSSWNSYGGGDGHSVLIDPTDQLTYYECYQPSPPSISCARDVDAAASGSTTSTSSTFSSPSWPSTTRISTDMPMVLDPADPKVVYVAGTSIARSAPGSVTSWTLISPTTPDSADSLPGPVAQNELNPDTYYANEYGAVTQIAPAASTGSASTPASTIYAGTDTGLVWRTTNADANPSQIVWERLGEGVLPQRWVTAIAVDPTDAGHAFISFSSYKDGDRSANVWELSNGTWSNISDNLPSAPVWTVTYDQPRNRLYAATSFGLFYRDLGSAGEWLRLGDGLPNCPILDVKLADGGSTVVAGTFGRGIYRTAAP
jgi:hypothetical protein